MHKQGLASSHWVSKLAAVVYVELSILWASLSISQQETIGYFGSHAFPHYKKLRTIVGFRVRHAENKASVRIEMAAGRLEIWRLWLDLGRLLTLIGE